MVLVEGEIMSVQETVAARLREIAKKVEDGEYGDGDSNFEFVTVADDLEDAVFFEGSD